LGEQDEEQLELRLLTNAAYAEEFDIVVNELTDQYVAGELSMEESGRVEEYFLRAADRRDKVSFASVLMQHASVEQGNKRLTTTPQPSLPFSNSILETLRRLWHGQSPIARLATAGALLIITAGILLLYTRSSTTPAETFVALTLTTTTDARGTGTQTKTVRLPPNAAGLKISLRLPDETILSNNYRVELVNQDGTSRSMAVSDKDPQSVTVSVPAGDLKKGSHALRLFTIAADGDDAVSHGNLDFLLFDVGKLELDEIFVLAFADIGERQPILARPLIARHRIFRQVAGRKSTQRIPHFAKWFPMQHDHADSS